MDTSKAWRFDRYGDPSVMQLVERPRPQPGPGEVLIKVLAAGVNPSDVKNVSGHFQSTLPRVPGRDFAGVIVGGAREGEEVWGSGPGFGVTRDGVHQEYITMPEAWLARRPPGLPAEVAAAAGVPWLAAWSALITQGKLQAGQTVLVTGISGSVGSAATQIAHQLNARVIGVGRSSANPSGADVVIDTTTQDLVTEVRALTERRGVDLVLDAVGGPMFEPCLRTLCHGGRQIAIASNPQVVSFNLVDFYHNSAQLAGVDTMALSGPEVASILSQLSEGFATGRYHTPTIQTWAFEQTIDAYSAVLAAGQPIKHVLKMFP
ncbi:zinc-binding alcohol dehydrogenase family protein [Acidithiobacillus sp. IBUN Pt1247-S3]|uniref:quinone oxidoreductase family protein n=1 Tax=Acidithiobacillus sp. IBUN Pt1247-S3 TaxID=3166642 RepID=UPI0034E59980